MARDPDRIPVVLQALREAWEKYPDFRLGQLVEHQSGEKPSAYFVDDDVMLKRLEAFAAEAAEVPVLT